MKGRIGIDVGGTFTDAVAINNDTYELIGTVKVPTTHTAKEGVAAGIVEAVSYTHLDVYKRQALKGVDLEIYVGDILSIVGQNGSGKTTLVLSLIHISPRRFFPVPRPDLR